jgi:hypothetical protein
MLFFGAMNLETMVAGSSLFLNLLQRERQKQGAFVAVQN